MAYPVADLYGEMAFIAALSIGAAKR